MNYILDIAAFFAKNWVEIGVAYGYLVAGARILVRLTPTPVDDSLLAKVVAAARVIGLHVD